MTTTTPNMSMILPDDHGSAELWGLLISAALTLNDSHNHSAGKGVKVPTGGLNIDADLSFSPSGTPRAITDLKAVDFAPVASSAVTALAGAFFVSDGTGGLANGELYFRTTAGSNVRFTVGAALNVAAFTGGIGGDYAAVGAAVAFDDALDRYTFKQQGNLWARMASGEVRILETGTSEALYVGIACPAALAVSYTITLPLAAPGSTSLVQMDAAGVLTASNVTIGGTPNFTGAVTMASTLGVTGLITATAGVTAAANQSVTVSGTGDIKHGSRTIVVSAAAFSPGNNFSSATINYGASSNEWAMGAAPNDNLGADVPLRAGDRITSLVWHFNKNTSASGMIFALNTRNVTTVTTRDTVTDVSAGGAFTTSVRSGINYTIQSGDATWLQVQSSNALHRFAHCVVTYDHP